MLIEQLFVLEKVRSSRSSCGWLVSNTVDGCLQGHIAQKIFTSKFEASPVKAGDYMACKHRMSFANDLAANFVALVAIDSESHLTSFPRFCAPPSEVAVLFDSNLSRCPFLGQVVDLDLLLCTGFDSEHSVLFLCHIFTQRPMTDRKIERSDGRSFGLQQLLAGKKQ